MMDDGGGGQLDFFWMVVTWTTAAWYFSLPQCLRQQRMEAVAVARTRTRSNVHCRLPHGGGCHARATRDANTTQAHDAPDTQAHVGCSSNPPGPISLLPRNLPCFVILNPP